MKKTTLYIPEDLAISVAATAKRTGTSEAALIREAIATYIASVERPLPRSIGIASDGTVQPEDIEDWIIENWRPE
jgi:hypothetical protein